jgi:hypothetical protein
VCTPASLCVERWPQHGLHCGLVFLPFPVQSRAPLRAVLSDLGVVRGVA